jgi:hypothetical protein
LAATSRCLLLIVLQRRRHGGDGCILLRIRLSSSSPVL